MKAPNLNWNFNNDLNGAATATRLWRYHYQQGRNEVMEENPAPLSFYQTWSTAQKGNE
jgi:hypothetical protein